MNPVRGILHLFYPELCIACGKGLASDEQLICLECRLSLPRTDFHKNRDNPAEKVFWGRFPIEQASAYLYFEKSAGVQQIMHHIKYRGGKETAMLMGRWYGDELMKSVIYKNPDYIIPVPLHKSKLISRGYNQSEWFGKGLALAMNVPLQTEILLRARKSETQTKKTRYKRWENVSEIFEVIHPEMLKNKHILLVDDVMTTGATLEACAQTILALNCGTKISIATLAFAH
jgi:ComF family protein